MDGSQEPLSEILDATLKELMVGLEAATGLVLVTSGQAQPPVPGTSAIPDTLRSKSIQVRSLVHELGAELAKLRHALVGTPNPAIAGPGHLAIDRSDVRGYGPR